MRHALRLTLTVVAALGLAAPAAAQSQSAKPRSSSASGIAVQPADRVTGPAASGGGSGGEPLRPRPVAATAQPGQGEEASQAIDRGDGGVRIDGNTTTNAQGSQLNSTAIGGKNKGCNSVGSISGRGC